MDQYREVCFSSYLLLCHKPVQYLWLKTMTTSILLTNLQCRQDLAGQLIPILLNQLDDLRAGGWNQPKAHSLTCQVADAAS